MKAKMDSIAQICRKLGLSARTVRYYEELGLLPGVGCPNGGRLVYSAEELERLRFIQRLKQLGLTLEEIGQLNAVYGIRGSTRVMLERLRELLNTRLGDVETKLQELQALQSEMTSYRDRVERRIDGLRRREEDKLYANGQS
jgi:MerR family transcriptional regulator, repressor of the yfmOP operon